jgi:coenzyme F420 hydrogenase subunit beta
MKKKNNSNISFVVGNQMCTGCGICEDVCPKNAILIKQILGENRPRVNKDLCLGEKCGRCMKVCPGMGTPLKSYADQLFDAGGLKEDKYIGKYVGLHTGYSLDSDIRYHCASGGMVSQMLIFLLDKGIIDGAVVTGFGDDHITPVSYIAKTKEEILAAKSSKYCPVSLNKLGNEIVANDGKYIIVGLPCHIQGFRKRMLIDKKFKEHVVGLFSIYCSSNRTFGARDYILKRYKINKSAISYFSFRDEGCLGSLKVITKKIVTIPFSKYYAPMLRSFFKPHRCLTCIDHYGALADVCFGDIHIKPYSDDHVGISSWISRSEYWERLFSQAAYEGYIHMDNIEADILNRSQATMLYPKERKAHAVIKMDKMLGRSVPDYNKELEKPKIKDYISEIICHLQRFIGRHSALWFIINILQKKEK